MYCFITAVSFIFLYRPYENSYIPDQLHPYHLSKP